MSGGFDVIIDFDSNFGSYIRNLSCKKIAFFHFSLNAMRNQDQHRLRKHFVKYDNVVVISDAMKAEADEMFPDISDKFVRIYNGIDSEHCHRKAQESVSDPDFYAPYMLAVERLSETQKDITTLICAYRNVLNADNNAPKMIVIGEGNSRPQLEQLIRENNLEDKFILKGFVANPYPWIANAALIVHSSKFDGLPTCMIEALSFGKAVIATDCSTGPKEILDDGRVGILTKIQDVNSLSEAIISVLKNDELKSQMERSAVEFFDVFSGKSSVAELEKII